MTLGLVACAASNEDDGGGGAGASTTGVGGGVSSNSGSSSSGASVVGSATTVTSSTTSNASVASSSSTGPNLCGNGVRDPGEFCDKDDFGGMTCEDFGLARGDLICNVACGIVVTSCIPYETCFDETDNDDDGFLDCEDSECAEKPACTDSCISPPNVAVPSNGGGSLDGKPNSIRSSCSPHDGPEVVFRVTVPADGKLAVRFSASSRRGSVAIRTSCNDAGTELGCAALPPTGGSAQLARSVTAGQVVFVVFEEGSVDHSERYDYDIVVPSPEVSCTDFFDEDYDGLMDCDDPDACQTLDACIPLPGADPYGASCGTNNECQANGNDPVCLNADNGFVDGYCSEFCDLATDDCSGDGVCLATALSPIHGLCWDGCVTDLECPLGLSCVESGIPGQKICGNAPEVSCNDLGDNDGDGLVDCEDKNACFTSPQCAPGPNAVGSPCQLHNQCQANDNDPFCIDQFHLGWVGGYCTEFCDLAAPDCPAGSECMVSPLTLTLGHGICLATCSDAADCRPGYSCQDEGAFSVCVD